MQLNLDRATAMPRHDSRNHPSILPLNPGRGSFMRAYTYKHHLKIQLYGGIILAAYFICAFFHYQEPFPFFNWSLYPAASSYASRYDIVITALYPNVKLDQPVFLGELKAEYNQDWLQEPLKVIEPFGYHVTSGAPPMAIEWARQMVENYLRPYPYVEYDLVRLDYDVINFSDGTRKVSYHKIASFNKEARVAH
jgi:hypothetical protein